MNRRAAAPYRVDRRTTIKWLAATMTAGSGMASCASHLGDEIPPATHAGGSLLGIAATSGGPGYGTDPDLGNPVIPWSRTMTRGQLATAAALSDYILPADEHSPSASTLGVHEFIDEWVSAPYAQQQEDRKIILAGLEALERYSVDLYGKTFVNVTEQQAVQILDDMAYPYDAAATSAVFFDRFRYLAVGAFYTTQSGRDDLGYIGNTPITGPYPGPSAAALAHLDGVLQQLGLA